MKKKTISAGKIADYFIAIITHIVLVIIFALVLTAIFDTNNRGEASIGTFDVAEFTDNWTLAKEGEDSIITLPMRVECNEGEVVSIKNTLPDNIVKNMSLMIRASMEDVYIFVDGELREEYSSDTIRDISFYNPSAYVVAKLDEADSSKDIRIDIRFKSQGIINSVSLGYGNDVWFPILTNSVPVNLAAVIVLILGILLTVSVSILHKEIKNTLVARYLGFLMIDVAIWVISESTIRQFIFERPSLTEIFSFLTVELMGALVCMYFDEVQHKKYHKIYRILEMIVIAQLVINLVLHVVGWVDMFKTLIISHSWTAIGIVLVIINIVKDIIDKDVRKYRLNAIGMACFVLMSIVELAGFYITRFYVLGTYVCVGLVLLMIFTIVQTLVDEMSASREREKKQFEMIRNTIETIAGSIDAKDEYTGGHSERVGLYAERLAREIAADYGFSEEDILRIRYIGLVHDIGKIGVADTVLNKAGRLTDEEFSLMKKHTEIGFEIMGSMGESMEGLLDGIRYHHERFDGKGYPKGLSYTEIPIVARILALADSYDAMTSNRVYRKRLTDEEVRNEFIKCSGQQFDPTLTEAFVRLIDSGELKVTTQKGMAVDEEGAILLSSKLENRLHEDLLNNREVSNPTHVRMMCYVIKLMEKKKKRINVFFYGPKFDSGMKDGSVSENGISENYLETTWKNIGACTREFVTGRDMIIRYNSELNVIALFDRDETSIKEFTKALGKVENVGYYSLK